MVPAGGGARRASGFAAAALRPGIGTRGHSIAAAVKDVAMFISDAVGPAPWRRTSELAGDRGMQARCAPHA